MIAPFYFKDDKFFILDQRRLPHEEVWITCDKALNVADAIKTLAVRGAPAIGIAAAFGLALDAKRGQKEFLHAAEMLKGARPTAVNLSWAVNRVLLVARECSESNLYGVAKLEAEKIWDEEKAANKTMAAHGIEWFLEKKKYRILTHCNTGTLATGGIGTALGIIRKLYSSGKLSMVYVDETRPLLQGARLTAYELNSDKIPSTLITDNMAGWLMKQGRIDAVIVGADRIAKNLDTANKIGTYSLAVLAHAHKIPFYVAAPISTFDPEISTGNEIPIEERSRQEVLGFGSRTWAPEVEVYNPAFDVTPGVLITAVITEKGIFKSSACSKLS